MGRRRERERERENGEILKRGKGEEQAVGESEQRGGRVFVFSRENRRE
jgi:hypothetical protein